MYTFESLRRFLLIGAASAALIGSAAAQSAHKVSFDIPPEDLGTALNQAAQQSQQEIAFDAALTRGKQSPGVKGNYTPSQAINALLAGTGLALQSNGGVLTVRPKNVEAASNAGAANPDAPDLETVVVTGTRIRGAAPTSPVIEITQQQMYQAGHYTLGDVVKAIPQNFSGGQNPGVLLGASAGSESNENDTGASTINLRGLGPDATLTLLDGQRLSYNSYSQGIDLSAIPVAAVDRIEIVADGASAIYGSDAVAGVANIILKKDFSGLLASARVATATDGGDFQQQYSLVGGETWDSGGFIAAYDYGKDTAVYARQRDYASYLADPYMLLPPNDHNSVVLSGHQDIGSFATFTVDVLYNHRNSNNIYTTPPVTVTALASDESYSVSPSIDFTLPYSWTLSVDGVYARDNGTRHRRIFYSDSNQTYSLLHTCYCNQAESGEATAEGPLFQLPGGDARAAVGLGYRQNSYDAKAPAGRSVSGSQSSWYGYSEFYLPFVGEKNAISYVNELAVTAAVRFEDYPRIGSITTPKVGVTYAPTSDFELKGAWGRSFKAPTLDQQFEPFEAVLYPASEIGGVGYPDSATAIITAGGNSALKPERAETETATIDFHPAWLSGLHADVSYFNVRYKNRIIAPFTYFTILAIPSYRDFVTLNPSAGAINKVITTAVGGLQNYSGAPYDPANVVALANGNFTNVAAQDLDGIDTDIAYAFSIGPNALSLTNTTSYLHSTQRNSPSATSFNLSGYVYNPPQWRSRTGVQLSRDGLTVSAFWNYVGGVNDNTLTPTFEGDPMNTIDLIGTYVIDDGESLTQGLQLSLSISNIFDARPPYLKNQYPYIPDYDSTNYSAVGRLISFSISKKF